MKTFYLYLFALLPLVSLGQTTFTKLYPKANEGDQFRDMVVVSANKYAFITHTLFYLVDAQGGILLKKDLAQGHPTSLLSVVADDNENIFIAAFVANPTDPGVVLLKLAPDGQLLLTQPVISEYLHLEMSLAFDNHLFISYTTPVANKYVLHTTLLDDQGVPAWKREISLEHIRTFASATSQHGLHHIVYTTADDNRAVLVRVDMLGNFLEDQLELVHPLNTDLYTHDITFTFDGGFIAVGEVASFLPKNDGLLYKVAQNGRVEWQEVINVHRSDVFRSVVPLSDGYMIAADAGFDQNDDNRAIGDIALVKTNLQGKVAWQKALGSSRVDYAKKLLTPDAQHLLLGGLVSYPGVEWTTPVLFKTDRRGNFVETLPFQPKPTIPFTHIEPVHDGRVKELVNMAPLDAHTYVAGINILHREDDMIYPYIIKFDQTGKELLLRKTLDAPGSMKAFTTTADGFFLSLSEQPDVFGNFYTLIKSASGGNAFFISNFHANDIRDMIGTADGGVILVGTEGLAAAQYDVVVIRLDKVGQEIWRKKIGVSNQVEIAHRIIETPEHDYILAGTARFNNQLFTQGLVLKLNQDGNVLWQKNYPAPQGYGGLADITLTRDKGYVMTGSTGADITQSDVWVLRINGEGNLLWERKFDLHKLDKGLSLLYTAGDSILVAGTTGESVTGKLENFGFLLKLNKDGNQPGIQYYGRPDTRADIIKLWGQDNRLMMAGNAQYSYGDGYMYFAEAGKGTVAIPGTEPDPGPVPPHNLIVYPSPADARVFIAMNNEFTGPVNMILFNTAGQQLVAHQSTKTGSAWKETISVASLATGLYYFHVRYGTEKAVLPFRVVHP